MNPTTLTDKQYAGLLKLGDVVMPGTPAMPSFSASGCAAGIDGMLPYMHTADRDSLLMLLDACARLPKPAVRGIVALAASARRHPEPLAGLLRLANIGIKGVVCSQYYSDIGSPQGVIHRALGWDATVVMREPEPNSQKRNSQ